MMSVGLPPVEAGNGASAPAERLPMPLDPRMQRTLDWLNQYQPDLWNHLDRVPHLGQPAGREILAGFLRLACQCQHVGNILIGRHGITAVPRPWVREHIEEVAGQTLNLEDEWEYRRLLEVCQMLDPQLLRHFVERGLASPDEYVREAAEDFSGTRQGP
jgi:hypothetical protein